ncbi:hypothetical protein NBE98_11340 [Clostridium swellfunianum]|uniref:hypothetical protein n=1 Tax=Clostridium swellfunianum TaxID=1367462 RepID=UPI00202FCD86|nr:hypothetical protein [Clostridium swellfunianum]MCM0648967.1 hypothetical protein [Clostridium swellfunianum]
MKYTRYDMKRKNNGNLVLGLVLFSTLVFAFLIGTVVSNVFLKNSARKDEVIKPQNAVDVANKTEIKGKVKYIAVQGGKFREAPGVEKTKNALSTYGNPFTIQDPDGTRVLLGIYSEEEALSKIKLLTENNIDNSKMIFELGGSGDACDEAIAAAIGAELDVLSKLSEKDVQSVNSSEIKEWLKGLKDVDKNSKNFALLEELKAQINGLPEKLEKEKAPEYYSFLYGYMKKLAGK